MHVFIGLTAFLIIIKKEIPEGNQLGANSHVDEQFNFVDVKIILGERERVISLSNNFHDPTKKHIYFSHA